MLISSAYAQAAAGAADPAGSIMQFLPIILMFVGLWFLMIRPQQKRAKEHKAMLDALAKGDEIVTGGGIAGRVVKVGENFIAVELATGVEVQVQKPSIALVLPKGTLKAL
ncbi:MAG: preprotein translocase subunit YajC [Pseudomonadota bacterium]|nr:preprotein translocase subunit YajC [Pseudomonadota bacterium]